MRSVLDVVVEVDALAQRAALVRRTVLAHSQVRLDHRRGRRVVGRKGDGVVQVEHARSGGAEVRDRGRVGVGDRPDVVPVGRKLTK